MMSSVKNLIILLVLIDAIWGSPLEFQQLVTIDSTAGEDPRYRLTDDVLPSKYSISITPYFEAEGEKEAFTFDGIVKITLKATKPGVNQIVLHANSLNISQYSFGDGTSLNYNPSQYSSEYDKWTIPIPSDLNGGVLSSATDTVLEVVYRGYMKDDMYGFYRSYYTENDKKVWMGTTQFQPVHARRAFPCFDEPGFKALFDIIIRRPRDIAGSLANTKLASDPVLNTTDNRFEDVYKTTPLMSTYLVAFIVSNYSGSAKNTDKFGVFARPEAKNHTDYAVDFGIEMLKLFSEYFDIDYYNVTNVEKMDMVAIPDFSAGAMENWALLTYRETGILYDPETTPTLSQQRIAAVIAHEQLHQWFGDLVTCKWWSETWMNEGFARYFQFMGTALYYKNWELEEQFVVENLQQSMQLDSTDSTHPMTSPVNTKSEASAIFDNISYNKAASILRMLAYNIGHGKFQEILRHHLRENALKAVVPQDFFDAIRNITDADKSNFFKSWTEQSGFPLVQATIDGKKLKLSQKRFMRDGINNDKTEKYILPISYALDGNGFGDPTHKFIFPASDSFEHELDKAPEKYFMLNVQQTGFYRVNYDNDNWRKIKEALFADDFKSIHVLNRAQVVDDLFNLARGGVVSYPFAIDILHFLKNETHYIPWLSAINHGLTFLSQRVKTTDEKIFSWYVTDIMDGAYQYLKFEPKSSETRTEIYNRINILTWLCRYGHEECIQKSKDLFADYKTNGTEVPKDHRTLVYCNAIRYGGDDEFTFLSDRLHVENVAAEQLNILNALTCANNQELVNKLLDKLIKADDIRAQDRNTVINGILNNNINGPERFFNYLSSITSLDAWKAKLGDWNILSTIVGRFTTAEQIKKFSDFVDQNKIHLSSSLESLEKAATGANKNLEWDEKHMSEFIKYLNELNGATVKKISIVLGTLALLFLYIFN